MTEAETPDAQCAVFLDHKCNICDVNDIGFKCLNCDELLCDCCKKMHLKSKVAKNHKVVCLESADIHQNRETKCPIHTKEDLLMYCNTCKYPICRDCIAGGSHHNHQMIKIENVIDNKQTELSKLINQSKEKSSQYEDAVTSIDKNSREFSMAVSQKIEEIKARNNQLKTKLDDMASDYIKQLQDIDAENKKTMEELKQGLQGDIEELNQLIQQCKSKKRDGNIEIVQFVADVTQRLDKYAPRDLPDVAFPPNLITGDVDDQELVKLFGYLDTKTTTKDDQLIAQKNVPSTGPATDVKIVSAFTSGKNSVVTLDNDQAWIWGRSGKGISLVTSDGEVTQNIDTDFELLGAAVAKSGDLLVTVRLGNKVKKLTADGTFTDIYTAASDYRTHCITVTDTGNVLVGLYRKSDSKIVEITTSRQHIRTIHQTDTVDKKVLFSNPVSICTNINGDVIVADGFRRVVSVNRSGKKRFIYDGKERKLNESFNPWCVVADKHGNVMITDFNNSVVHMLNQDGKFLQYLITREHGCDGPAGMSIDISGRLWVCDRLNDKVFIVKYL